MLSCGITLTYMTLSFCSDKMIIEHGNDSIRSSNAGCSSMHSIGMACRAFASTSGMGSRDSSTSNYAIQPFVPTEYLPAE